MERPKDRFSDRASLYSKFRPVYPEALIDDIVSLSTQRKNCWDCGTGNGQVALLLSRHFDQVYATDISEQQLRHAQNTSNIQYSIARAEQSELPANLFDLITVAQAAHWFDLAAFYKEVERVAKDGCILAIWGYGLLRFHQELDRKINLFYKQIVGPYWDEERKQVEGHYADLFFPYDLIHLSGTYEITKDFTLADIRGYLSTWSSVKRFIEAKGYDPVPNFIEEITQFWSNRDHKLQARFPIFTKITRIRKNS